MGTESYSGNTRKEVLHMVSDIYGSCSALSLDSASVQIPYDEQFPENGEAASSQLHNCDEDVTCEIAD
jgi:hypothetical protein